MAKKEVKLVNDEDAVKLVEIFTGLHMDPTLLHDRMLTNKWIDIGFQGEDPTTDFRGTGSLGMINLHYFVTKRNKDALNCLAHARDKKTEYFLACSGINVTYHMVRLFQSPEICLHFTTVSNNEEIMAVFNGLYSSFISKLDEYWVKSPLSYSFMNFNTVTVG